MQMKIRIVRKGLDISQQNVWRTAIQNLPNISRSSKHRTNYIYEIMKHNMCLIDISINFTFLLFNWLLSILWVVGAVKLTHQKQAPTTQNPPPEPPLPPSSQWVGQPGAPSELANYSSSDVDRRMGGRPNTQGPSTATNLIGYWTVGPAPTDLILIDNMRNQHSSFIILSL